MRLEKVSEFNVFNSFRESHFNTPQFIQLVLNIDEVKNASARKASLHTFLY